MASNNALHVLVTILAFSYLFFFIDLATSSNSFSPYWAILLDQESRPIPSPEDTFQMSKAENMREIMDMVEDEFFRSRMDLEIINRDYPGSGANNRHTPNPPVKD
ncbi:uncharacterized protein LOC110011595 isoform X1 [Sesamum indicum]|uniref:Uncharacterized protein LOC110011595 isoform X1 n=1 Tax=Sesamum indicum TaxID=4182 RepID=A0A8M8ULI6_SESIN|nr:uncharacterized protein LOC110011595 isoform X1 [Sesamum indicum]